MFGEVYSQTLTYIHTGDRHVFVHPPVWHVVHSQECSGTSKTGTLGTSGRLLGIDVHVRGMTKKTNSLLLLPLLCHLHREIKKNISYHLCNLAEAFRSAPCGGGTCGSREQCFWARAGACHLANMDSNSAGFLVHLCSVWIIRKWATNRKNSHEPELRI